MADPILEKAVAKRDAAQREVNKWTNFIDGYRELTQKAVVDTAGAVVPIAPPAPLRGLRPGRQPPRPVARDLHPDSELGKTVAVVEAVLNERGQPMPLAVLHEAITRKGFVITGDKPRDNLSARLYNSGRFRSLGKFTGWWFADRPLPVKPRPGGQTNSPPDASGSTDASTGNSGSLFAPGDKLNGSVSQHALLSMGGQPTMGH